MASSCPELALATGASETLFSVEVFEGLFFGGKSLSQFVTECIENNEIGRNDQSMENVAQASITTLLVRSTRHKNLVSRSVNLHNSASICYIRLTKKNCKSLEGDSKHKFPFQESSSSTTFARKNAPAMGTDDDKPADLASHVHYSISHIRMLNSVELERASRSVV